ncbi:hypothetical protein HanIR_Chr17g0860761 [Helianthus annuus]|nr:hypothetical protein HanIR_Chr17g0860761 [Helianthus annuus]
MEIICSNLCSQQVISKDLDDRRASLSKKILTGLDTLNRVREEGNQFARQGVVLLSLQFIQLKYYLVV